MELKDTQVKITRALPASTVAVTSGSAIDTGKATSLGKQLADMELLVSAPAVTLTQLPNTKTFTYDLVHSANSDLSSPAVLATALIVQTGATGTDPCPAATARYRLPTDARRYIGLRITPSASGTGDASAATATLEALF